MVTCPLCLIQVEELKTNSHIFPRWMIKSIKTNGKVIEVKTQDNSVKSQQSDMKADIVCAKCEDLFTECDTFSDKFYKYEFYRDRPIVTKDGSRKLVLETHKEEAKPLLIRFLASLILRSHLFKLKEGDLSFQKFFDVLREAFVQKSLEKISLNVQVIKYTALPRYHAFPMINKEAADSIEVSIFGQRTILYFGSVPAAYVPIVSDPKIVVLPIVGKHNALYRDLHTFAKANPIQNRRK